MPRLDPLQKGFLQAGLAVGAIALGFVLLIHQAASPSPELMRDLAAAGIGLLIAYSVAISSAEKVLSDLSDGEKDNHENWLGVAVGMGICGLVGVGVAFAVAEHRAAGHSGWLDDFGLAWVLVSIGLLGLVVALLPYATYNWRKGT